MPKPCKAMPPTAPDYANRKPVGRWKCPVKGHDIIEDPFWEHGKPKCTWLGCNHTLMPKESEEPFFTPEEFEAFKALGRAQREAKP